MQITTVKVIRVLTEIGVPLNTIKELAVNRTPLTLMKLLSKYQDIVADELRFLEDVLSVISTFLEMLNKGMSATETELTVSELPEKRIILGDITDYGDSGNFYAEFTRFCNSQREPKLNLSYPVGGYFESMEVFFHESFPTRFYSIDPRGNDTQPAGLYLTGYSRGFYGHSHDLPEQMAAYAKKNGLVFSGPVYSSFLFDEISVVDPDQYLLQVSASVRETRRVPARRPRRYQSE
jgi:effector-binding domain-containing protein